MDQATREFLIWFDGFCENVEAVPTQKQWGRVLEKIKAMAEKAQAEPVTTVTHYAGPPATIPPVTAIVPLAEAAADAAAETATVVQLTHTPRDIYRLHYRQKLKELGIDEESDLNDFVNLAMAQYNAQLDPRKEAVRFFNHMFPGTNAK